MGPRQHGPLTVAVAVDAMFQTNTLLLWPADGRDCWIVDPGFAPSAATVLDMIKRHELKPAAIVLTHGHVDHIAGVGEVREALPDVPILAPRDDAFMLPDAAANLSANMGLAVVAPPADREVAGGDTLALGQLTFQALDVGGHSPGGLAFHCPAAQLVITGDSLFAGGIGRTDFPGSDHQRLIGNIKDKLLTLPAETVVYSGHGPTTTIGRERDSNPFLMPGVAL